MIKKLGIFFVALVLILTIVFSERNKKKEKEKEYLKNVDKQKTLLLREKILLRNKFKQACLEIWNAQRKIPVEGDGWVDITKIPADFLDIGKNDEGECQVENLAMRMVSFYWTGKEIVPKHPAFSGQPDPDGKIRIKSYGSSGHDYIPMYTPETWKEFSISVHFYNHRKLWTCENLMENYDYDYDGECRIKAVTDDGNFLMNGPERYTVNRRKIRYSPMRLIQAKIDPNFDMIINPGYSLETYLPHSNHIYYQLRNWPYEPFPALRMFIDRDFLGSKMYTSDHPMAKLTQYVPKKNKRFFFYDNSAKFYFPHGFVQHFQGNIELSDAPLFFLHLRIYFSEIFIAEY